MDEQQQSAADPVFSLLDAFEAEAEAGQEDAREFDKRSQARRAANPDADDEPNEAEPEDGEDAEAIEAEAEDTPDDAEDAADEPPGEDFIELDGTKVALTELIEARQWKQQAESNLRQIETQVYQQAQQRANQMLGEWDTRFQTLDTAAEAIMQLMPELEPPSRTMLQRGHPDFDPDTYHMIKDMQSEYAAKRQAAFSQVEEARQLAKRQADERQSHMHSEMLAQGVAALRREFPEQFGTPEAARKTASDLSDFLRSAYQFDDATINSVTDHRFWKLAMEAKAFRDAKARPLPKPKGAEKSAPRLVRSKAPAAPAAKGAKARNQALQALKKTGKITDREAIFGDFV